MNLYIETDERLHYLSQVLAKLNRTFMPSKEDDSHTNLYFDVLGNRITGRWIDTQETKILLCLHLEHQRFEFLNTSFEVLDSVSTTDKTMTQLESAIERRLSKLGLKPKGFIDKLHFDITAYSFKDEPIIKLSNKGLDEWRKVRDLANKSCQYLLGYAQGDSEIRIWPHHFDTGIYFQAKEGVHIGFGFAMRDHLVNSSYFYMYANSDKGVLSYENTPYSKDQNWYWELDQNWKGAVFPLAQDDFDSIVDKETLIKEYLKSCYDWFLKVS